MVQHSGRDRPAEVESLKLGTAQLAHNLRLVLRFNALRRRLHPKAASQGKDRMDDGDAVARALGSTADEALVDLDLGKMGATQIAERAVALAEIVEHQSHPKRAQPLERRERRRIVAK